MKEQQIRGTTRITGLLGNPVKHSISPLIHNHAFATLGLDYTYLPLGCAPEALSGLVQSLRDLNFAGANVTIPYKSDVLPLCDEVSELSQLTGTVNTLYMNDGKLCGTTTDADGFLDALARDGFDCKGKKVIILGNGGTSRTLAMVLAHRKLAASLAIAGRNSEKVATLADEIEEKTGSTIERLLFAEETFTSAVTTADLVVNCTPIGMSPNTDASPLAPEQFSSACYYFDAIYNPGQTTFLKQAEAAGARNQNGLAMLLFQGLKSFTYWTGETAPAEIFSFDELQQIVSK